MGRMPRFRLKSPRVKLTENDIEQVCCDLLAIRGYKLHRLHCGRARFPDGRWVTLEEQGTPDWLAVHPVHAAFYLETKAPGRVLSSAQRWAHKVLSDGYRMHVVVIDDVAELIAWLREHEEPTR
jgi:hypothetical protein